jgi:integrase
MASYKKDGSVWRVQVYVKGNRDSATFTTKRQAEEWALKREAELKQQVSTGIVQGKTVRDAFNKYEKEVSRTKRGARFEAMRLNVLADVVIQEPPKKFGDLKISELNASHIAQLRDARLLMAVGGRPMAGEAMSADKLVKTSTVNRELNIVSNVFTIARKEWKWIAVSPTKDVRRPKNPAPRDRRPTDDEISRLCLALGFHEDVAIQKKQRVAVAFLFAIETAMRAGEICALKPEWIEGRVAHLPGEYTKNRIKRDVPLSTRALELLGYLPKPEVGGTVFGLTSSSLDALFRRAKEQCEISDLTFHDSRHEAITRLAKKLGVLDLARMVGHTDLRMLQVYYNETAEEIAAKLG